MNYHCHRFHFADCESNQSNRGEDDPKKKAIEDTARQLHGWYLSATLKLNPENFNEKAQVQYDALNEEQKDIDRYIAEKILAVIIGIRREHKNAIEQIIRMADDLEHDCNRDGDKGTEQWKLFKGFRNTIRDKFLQ